MKVHNHDEWEELTKIINDYMISKNWTVEEGLYYFKYVLVKSAKIAGLTKFGLFMACESMKRDFDTYKGRIEYCKCKWNDYEKLDEKEMGED